MWCCAHVVGYLCVLTVRGVSEPPHDAAPQAQQVVWSAIVTTLRGSESDVGTAIVMSARSLVLSEAAVRRWPLNVTTRSADWSEEGQDARAALRYRHS